MYDETKLNRFLIQQEGVYQKVINELKRGEKQSHWMWFIFPQIKGLGYSNTSNFYDIVSLEEAQAYYQHPVLGKRLIECCTIMKNLQGRKIDQIFTKYPDDAKFRSSMTLFSGAIPENKLFDELLQKYFNGAKDRKTQMLLEK